MYQYTAIVNKIIDGDTVNMTIDLGFRLSYTANCRLAGINAPEMSTEQGRASKYNLALLIKVGNVYQINSESLDKYGRPLITIYIENYFQSVNMLMIEQGHAVKY